MTEQKTTRFAYVPLGSTFRMGTHGTVDFVKVDEDHATADGVACVFGLGHKCRLVTPPKPVKALHDISRKCAGCRASMDAHMDAQGRLANKPVEAARKQFMEIRNLEARVKELESQIASWRVARPISEYHEDMGCALWFEYPICEPPYVGTTNDCDWPGYHTHFVRLTNEMIPVPKDELGEKLKGEGE